MNITYLLLNLSLLKSIKLNCNNLPSCQNQRHILHVAKRTQHRASNEDYGIRRPARRGDTTKRVTDAACRDKNEAKTYGYVSPSFGTYLLAFCYSGVLSDAHPVPLIGSCAPLRFIRRRPAAVDHLEPAFARRSIVRHRGSKVTLARLLWSLAPNAGKSGCLVVEDGRSLRTRSHAHWAGVAPT